MSTLPHGTAKGPHWGAASPVTNIKFGLPNVKLGL